jgi:hypothetical protein
MSSENKTLQMLWSFRKHLVTSQTQVHRAQPSEHPGRTRVASRFAEQYHKLQDPPQYFRSIIDLAIPIYRAIKLPKPVVILLNLESCSLFVFKLLRTSQGRAIVTGFICITPAATTIKKQCWPCLEHICCIFRRGKVFPRLDAFV